jgi:RND superfamily putative drug exporter
MNIAARAGRWSAAHWKTATLGWLALVIIAVAAGGVAGTVKMTSSEQSTGESGRAQALLDRAGFHDHAGELVLVRSATRTAADPEFAHELRRVVTTLGALHQVEGVRSPLGGANGRQISKDRHSALIEFELKGSPDTASERVQPILNEVAALQRAAPGFTIAEFGDASATHELGKATNSGLARAERLSLPITFLVLLVAFGAFVAAGLPVLLAFSAVLGSSGLSAVASHVVHASGATSSVILLMGMAVGVDYSLFYLKREREERRAGRGADALQLAAATSGRAVLVSGVTVLIAMAGMLISGTKVFDSIAVGAMLVVLLAMVGSLTVLPALLGRLGDKVEKGRLRRGRPTSRVWDALLRPVLRFPALAALLATGALVALALPALGLRATLIGPGDLPRSIPIVKAYDKLQNAFPGARTSSLRAPARRSAGCGGWRSRAGRRGSRSRPSSTRGRRSRGSKCRSSAADRTRHLWTRCARCARRCCRRASGVCPARATR